MGLVALPHNARTTEQASWNTGGHTVFAAGNSMCVGVIGDVGAELHKVKELLGMALVALPHNARTYIADIMRLEKNRV